MPKVILTKKITKKRSSKTILILSMLYYRPSFRKQVELKLEIFKVQQILVILHAKYTQVDTFQTRFVQALEQCEWQQLPDKPKNFEQLFHQKSKLRIDRSGRKRCQKKRKDVSYQFLKEFFQNYFVIDKRSLVKNSFSTFV